MRDLSPNSERLSGKQAVHRELMGLTELQTSARRPRGVGPFVLAEALPTRLDIPQAAREREIRGPWDFPWAVLVPTVQATRPRRPQVRQARRRGAPAPVVRAPRSKVPSQVAEKTST
jgi:hypothetical protein